MSDPQFDAFKAAVHDRYVIESEIGRGGRGTVYRARETESSSTVALKVFHSDLASALDFTRFLKEMRKAARVRHPGIVPTLTVDEAAGRLYSVTPFLDGESLRTRFERERQLPLPEVVAITGQIAEALGHAHAEGVLHKDIKPESIFLTNGRALLMDLGVARAISRAMDETMTGTGLSLGTPAYMSPEHARGGVEIDGRADLYSLGCVLYEMLAGEPPFAGTTRTGTWRRVVSDTQVPTSAVRDSRPPAVGTTLDRLLAAKPSERFPDTAHLVEALSTLSA